MLMRVADNGLSFHRIKEADRHSLALLERAYYDLYLPAFPMQEEQETFERWTEFYTVPSDEVAFVTFIVGDNLDRPDDCHIRALSIGEYYKQKNVSLLAYTAVEPQSRRQGLWFTLTGMRITEFRRLARESGRTLDAVFLEVNNPERIRPEDDSFDPAQRLAILKKQGWQTMPVDYVAPPLKEGDQRCQDLLLLARPGGEDGAKVSADATRAFLQGIYSTCGVPDYEQDPYFRAMCAQLQQ